MSKLDKLRSMPDSDMKAVVIYDSVAFAAQANTTLQRAGHRVDVNVRWSITPWRLNALKDHATAAEVLREAADAHLIVLACQSSESLPFWLREWLRRWANIRQIPDAALAVIGNSNGGLSRPMSPELSRFAREHGLTFFIDEGPAAKDAVKLFIRRSRERKLSVPIAESRFGNTGTGDSYRSWGIND